VNKKGREVQKKSPVKREHKDSPASIGSGQIWS